MWWWCTARGPTACAWQTTAEAELLTRSSKAAAPAAGVLADGRRPPSARLAPCSTSLGTSRAPAQHPAVRSGQSGPERQACAAAAAHTRRALLPLLTQRRVSAGSARCHSQSWKLWRQSPPGRALLHLCWPEGSLTAARPQNTPSKQRRQVQLGRTAAPTRQMLTSQPPLWQGRQQAAPMLSSSFPP